MSPLPQESPRTSPLTLSLEQYELSAQGGQRIGVVKLQPATRLVVWSAGALDALDAFLTDLDLTGMAALAFIAEGSVFGAGADLTEFQRITDEDTAQEAAARAYRAFDRLNALSVPTFSFLNGPALGGGLEFALHTDFRVAARSVRAIGLPEVSLGVIPGWGGLTNLTALIGPQATAEIAVLDSLAGRNADAVRALKIGIVDAVLDSEDFLAQALIWAENVLATSVIVKRRDALTAAQWNPDAVRERVRGRIPAPLACVDSALNLIAKSATAHHPGFTAPTTAPDASSTGGLGLAAARERIAVYAAGAPGADAHDVVVRESADGIRPELLAQPLARETIAAFGRLLMTDEARASIYAFFALQQVRKLARPGGDQLSVSRIGVVGGGLMATQLAVLFATRLRVPVVVVEIDQERADAAAARISDLLESAHRRGSLSDADLVEITRLITPVADASALAESDVVVEAVFEELQVKEHVWQQVEPLVSPEALLLTNTSSLSVGAQGTVLRHPERLIGFHFFNPVAVLPLVELIIPIEVSADADTSAADTRAFADTALDLAARLGKTAIRVADHPGFLVNRLLSRLMGDALHLIDHGWDVEVADSALVDDGLPMTPLTLLDYIGHSVQLHIFETLHDAWPQRFPVSLSLSRLTAAVNKSAAAPRLRYLDASGQLTPEADEAIQYARAAASPDCGMSPGRSISTDLARSAPSATGTAAEAREHLLDGLADEVSRILADGTAQSAQAIDSALILGANYPRHLGGLIPLLDRSGASRRATGAEFLPDGAANVPHGRS